MKLIINVDKLHMQILMIILIKNYLSELYVITHPLFLLVLKHLEQQLLLENLLSVDLVMITMHFVTKRKEIKNIKLTSKS